MNRTSWLSLMLLALFSLGGIAQAQTAASALPTPPGVNVTKAGDASILTGDKGLTLYTFDPDADGKSTCNGGCAAAWPPLVAADGAKLVGKFTIVTRDDGTKQWAYKGKPLYYYKADKAPMDTTGDGVGGRWHTAKP